MHRPMNNKTVQALENIIAANHVQDQLFKLGLDPEHLAIHQLHNVHPLIDLSYVIRVRDAKIITAFTNIQREIRTVIPDTHYYTDPQEFHITLYTHVYADERFQNCDITPATFAADYAKYCDWAKRQAQVIFEKQAAWGILYTSVIITPDAIVAVAEDTGHMQDVRKQLVQYGNSYHFYDQRDEKTIYPNIIHSTLVRFLTPVSLAERVAIYEKIKAQMPLMLPLQITEIEFHQFERYGLFPKTPPIFTTKLG